MKKRILVSIPVISMFLSSCGSMPDIKMPDMSKFIPKLSLPTPYKDDINQGSVLTRFSVNQLKIGMSETQVRNLIGSPSIIDPFHNNQWDYINHSSLHQKDDIHYRLSLKFDQGKLVDIDTSGLSSLPELTDAEKVLEQERINNELKAIAEAKKSQEQVKSLPIKTKQVAESAQPAEQIGTAPTQQQTITHVVKQGETLWHIAQTYNLDVEQLAQQNNISDNDVLSVGQQLIITKPLQK